MATTAPSESVITDLALLATFIGVVYIAFSSLMSWLLCVAYRSLFDESLEWIKAYGIYNLLWALSFIVGGFFVSLFGATPAGYIPACFLGIVLSILIFRLTLKLNGVESVLLGVVYAIVNVLLSLLLRGIASLGG